MEDLLSKLYDRVIFWEKESKELETKFDKETDQLLEELKATLTETQIKQISELVYRIIYRARKDGFLLGARCIVRLLEETSGT